MSHPKTSYGHETHPIRYPEPLEVWKPNKSYKTEVFFVSERGACMCNSQRHLALISAEEGSWCPWLVGIFGEFIKETEEVPLELLKDNKTRLSC